MESISLSQLKKQYATIFSSECQLDCGHGWQKILEDLCGAIDLIVRENGDPNFKITSIKQKFGVLMIDYDGGDDLIKEFIDFAQLLSYNRCEICGQEGKLYAAIKWANWSSYKTFCHIHAIQFHYYEIKLKKGKK